MKKIILKFQDILKIYFPSSLYVSHIILGNKGPSNFSLKSAVLTVLKFIDIENIKHITKNISIHRPIESDNLDKVKKYIINELTKLNHIEHDISSQLSRSYERLRTIENIIQMLSNEQDHKLPKNDIKKDGSEAEVYRGS